MNQQEAFKLLTRASTVDNRNVTQIAATVWADTLPDMPYTEAASLLDEWRRENPGVYFEPGHLRQQKLMRVARGREINGPHPAPPPGTRWAVDVIENDPQYGVGPGGVQVVSDGHEG